MIYLATSVPTKKTQSVIEICRAVSQSAWHWWSCWPPHSWGALVHPNHGSHGEKWWVRSRYFLPLLKFSNLYEDSEQSTGRTLQYSPPAENDRLNLLYKLLSRFPADVIWKLKFQSAFVWVKLDCTIPHLKFADGSKLYTDFNLQSTTTTKANAIFQPLVWSIQSQWDDYCDSLGPGTCQDFLISRIKMFLWYTLLFSGNI